MNIYNYLSPPWETSIYKGIPISKLKEFQKIMRDAKCSVQIRFRGPRKHRFDSWVNKSGHCLKKDAVSFAVYWR